MEPLQPKLLPLPLLHEKCPIAASVSDRTLRRWEQEGKFPKRRKISKQTYGHVESEVLEFQQDPEGWQRRQKGAA
jgi:predicted DNA-binding transcriptional regulator AlpA